MCRAGINATFWHFVCQSRCINSLKEIGSRGYHVYRETSWRNIHLHQHVLVLEEVNNISIDIDPYCCRITKKRVGRMVMSLESCLDLFLFHSRGRLGYCNSCKHHAKNITHPRKWVRGSNLTALYP